MDDVLTIKTFTEVDDGKWGLTERILDDPEMYRRVVATQIAELTALYAHYPLPELAGVGELLTELREEYSDIKPFNRPLLAALDTDDALIE